MQERYEALKAKKKAGVRSKEAATSIDDNPRQPNSNDSIPYNETDNDIPLIEKVLLKPLDIIHPFPMKVYPKKLQEIIKEMIENNNFSPDYIGIGIMGAFASAVGNTAYLELINGWTYRSSFYIGLVGRRGRNKSQPLKMALKPIFEYSKQLNEEFKIKIKDIPEIREDQDDVDVIDKICYLNTFTLEALKVSLHENPEGLLLYRDELDGFIQQMNAYRNGDDETFYIEAWDSGDFSGKTKKDGRITVTNPVINIMGTIQPEILRDSFGKNNRMASGFTDRFIFISPEATKKKPTQFQAPKTDYIKDYADLFADIFKRRNNFSPELQRRYLLSEEAHLAWVKYFNYLELEPYTKSLPDEIEAIYAKYEKMFGRIVLILHEIELACDPTYDNYKIIKASTVSNAFELVRNYLIPHAIKASNIMFSNEQDSLIMKVLEKIKENEGMIAKGDLQSKMNIKQVGELELLTGQLINEGIILKITLKPAGRGRHSEVYCTPDGLENKMARGKIEKVEGELLTYKRTGL